MIQFRLCNPTEIRFGTGQIDSLEELVASGARVLLLYGGGSIKANGIYDRVKSGLRGCHVVEFGGIEVNPVYETLLKAAEVARSNDIDLVLGVGGGSVADAAKFLATIIPMKSDDPWDELVAGGLPSAPLPVGIVLTLPATGSESNPVSVITSRSRHLKVPFQNEAARPRFAILDPLAMRSLSRRQLENGVVDAFTHVLEQYLTTRVNAPVQYGFSEAILETLIQWGPVLVEEHTEEAAENVMWAANQALNGLIGAGVPQDWSTHMIGHAITALYDIDHARTLSVIMPTLMRHKLREKREMLARYGRRVWKGHGLDDTEVALEAISRTEQFFARMGCPVRLSELGITVDPVALVDHLKRAGQTKLGEGQDIGPEAVHEILRQAA